MPSENYPLTLDEALIALRARQEIDPDNFKPGASEEEIQKANAGLPIPIPLAWQKILRISQEFYGQHWEIWPASGICMSNEAGPTFMEELPTPQLTVAGEGGGDYLTLDTSVLTPQGDCPLLWITHEGGEEDSRWESAGDFLQWILEDKDQE